MRLIFWLIAYAMILGILGPAVLLVSILDGAFLEGADVKGGWILPVIFYFRFLKRSSESFFVMVPEF